MLVLALAVWTGMAMLGDALRIREEEASRQRKADEQPSAQCRAIDSLKQLVAEAEDLDGVVNAALMEIEEAGDAESCVPPSVPAPFYAAPSTSDHDNFLARPRCLSSPFGNPSISTSSP